jgi:SAM-dependent methyltransferase
MDNPLKSAQAADPTQGIEYVTGPQFREVLQKDTAKWDREWLRYFQNSRNYKDFFYDMSGPGYALSLKRSEVMEFDERAMLEARPFFGYPLLLWATGKDIVGRSVLEIGCGPGLMGRIIGRWVANYWGLDFSPLAVSIARLTSPERCHYATLDDSATLRSLAGTIDTVVCRHFYIHQNLTSATWLLGLQRDFLKPGGSLIADFFGQETNPQGSIRSAASETDLLRPSTVFWFSDDEIAGLAGTVGLEIVSTTVIGGEWPRRYVRMRKPKTGKMSSVSAIETAAPA